MKYNSWFGKSWGAPVCDPEDHIATPVGEKCLWCDEPIKLNDQGVTAVHVTSNSVSHVRASHLDCFLKKILPHKSDCPRCRGLKLEDHASNCAYRQRGVECNCITLN